MLDRIRRLRQQEKNFILGLSSFFLMVLIHTQFQHQRYAFLIVPLLLALALWTWSLLAHPPTDDILGVVGNPLISFDLRNSSMLAISVLASASVLVQAGENEISADWLMPWLLALVLWMIFWWPRRTTAKPALGLPNEGRYLRIIFVLVMLLILAIGLFLRLHRLSDTPYEPSSDHAEQLRDMADMVDGQRPIFFERYGGREPLQFYINFALIKWLAQPVSFETLKLGGVLADTLVIAVIFFLASEMAGGTAGLIAATLYSIGKWPIAMSLTGTGAPLAALFSALVFWSLLRYMRTGNRRDALICGLCLGAGLYGYTPFRLVVPIVALALLGLFLFDRRWFGQRGKLVRHALLLAGTTLIVFLPFATLMLKHPELFNRPAPAETPSENPHSLISGLLAFSWRGDATPTHFLQNDPFLDPVMASALLISLPVALYQLVRRRSLRYGMLLLSVPIILLISSATPTLVEEYPSVNGLLVVAPLVIALAAFALDLMLSWAFSLPESRHRLAGYAVGGLLLLLTAQQNYSRVFHDLRLNSYQTSRGTREVAEAIRAAGAVGVDLEHAYQVPFPHWVDTANVGFMLGDPAWANSHLVDDALPLPGQAPGKPIFLIIHQHDERRLNEARERWPIGLQSLQQAPNGDGFYTFFVPPLTEEQPLSPTQQLEQPVAMVLDGIEMLISNSRHDLGSVNDLFDQNAETVLRGANVNPFVIDIEFLQPRTLSALDLTVATMDFEVLVEIVTTDGSVSQPISNQFRGLGNDPKVTVDLTGGPYNAKRLRLTIKDIVSPPESSIFIHVRELTLR